jgi:methionine-rich copper-binding protein CopC
LKWIKNKTNEDQKDKEEYTMRAALFSIILILILPLSAHSHVDIREKSPKENEVLDTSPEKVIISFYGSAEPTFSKIEVFDQDDQKVSLKSSVLKDGTVMEAGFSKKLTKGEYTVKWLCVSMDGHKMKGSYKFTVK